MPISIWYLPHHSISFCLICMLSEHETLITIVLCMVVVLRFVVDLSCYYTYNHHHHQLEGTCQKIVEQYHCGYCDIENDNHCIDWSIYKNCSSVRFIQFVTSLFWCTGKIVNVCIFRTRIGWHSFKYSVYNVICQFCFNFFP